MPKKFTIFIDGASRGNPGVGAVAFLVYDGNLKEIYRDGRKIGYCTNNIAEYRALIEALNYIRRMVGERTKNIYIYSDSELLVNQINGKYRVKNHKLKKLYDEAKKLIDDSGSRIIIRSIPREKNREADNLVNMILNDNS